MEDTLDMNPSSFGIQDTIQLGAGNQELLNDLLAPETSTSNPSDIQPIIKEVAPVIEKEKKSIVPLDSKEEENQSSVLSDFLSGEEEEEEEREEVVSKKKEVKQDSEEEESDSRFSALSKDLYKLGVFTEDENDENVEITTPEEFLEKFKNEKQKGAIEVVNNFIGQFGQDYQDAFDAIFVKGVSPKEYFGAYNEIVTFAEMDLSVERNQEKVISQALQDQGFDPEDIESEIERLKNYGDLETVAAKHHKVLIKKESSKLQEMEENSTKQLQQKAYIRNQYIQNVQTIMDEKLKSKEFDGIPLNPKLANEVQDFLLVDKYKTATGELLTDFDKTILDLKKPENHSMKVKLGLLLKILEKDPTLSTIQKTGLTKKSNELFGEIARQSTKTVGGKATAAKSWFE